MRYLCQLTRLYIYLVQHLSVLSREFYIQSTEGHFFLLKKRLHQPCYFREVFLFNVEIQLKLLFKENTEVLQVQCLPLTTVWPVQTEYHAVVKGVNRTNVSINNVRPAFIVSSKLHQTKIKKILMNSILLTSELPDQRHESITDLLYLQPYFSTSNKN